MLTAAFFVSVFTSIVWVFYVFSNQINGGISEFVVTTAVIVLPIFILWVIFGYIYQYISGSVLNKNMYSLFKQMKKNQDYADLIAKVLLEASDSLKDNVMLSKVDIFIADMNELLSDIIKRGQLATPEQTDELWVKVKNGGKWAFGKKIVELSQNQPNLPDKLLQKALVDAMLGGTILEFCSRYQNFIGALEKHDKERLFLNMIETGVLGKVFSVLAVPADSVRQNRDLTLAHRQISEEPETEIISEPEEKPTTNGLSESARRLFINTFTRKKTEKKKAEPEEENKDPLSLAFAKSFGAEEESVKEEPRFDSVVEETDTVEEENNISLSLPTEETDVTQPSEEFVETEPDSETVKPEEKPTEEIPSWESGFLKTKETLEEIRQEWEAAKQRDLSAAKEPEQTDEGMPEPKIGNDEDYSYPFGGWMNADNYK